MKRLLLLAVLSGAVAASVGETAGSCGTAYGLLVPRPVKVEVSGGEVDLSSVPVRYVRGEVPGAPASVAEEAYMLDIGGKEIVATASNSRGDRYARVTLDQLRALSGGRVPCGRIVDWPVLRWRGYMNDTGRNYLDLRGLKAVLDMMALYKLNLFHWHLTDYHGWRLESKKFPGLQDRKAFRRQVGRYYTQDEFREIVAYAADRGITVLPELDVPGHTLALRRGLGVETMADPGVEEKVAELFRELCSLAPADVMPFVHMGTDEARTREEKCDDSYVTTWAKAINACGRKAVIWAPGKKSSPDCDVIDMAWYDNHVTNSANPFLYADYVRLYNASWTPFDVLPNVVFADVRHWKGERSRQMGAVACTWQDDNVGEDTHWLFRECAVFPALPGFGDGFWSGRPADRPEFFARLPAPSDPLFGQAVEFERRLIAQRDTVLKDFAFAFPFVRQTDMRWRLTDVASGRVIATDIAQGSVWVRNRRVKSSSFVAAGTNTVALETWIRSPDDRTVGAWIDCSGYFGCYSRLGGRTCALGEWNPAGAKVLLNGSEIPPPEWKQPAMDSTTPANREQDIPYSTDLLEKPLVDELPMLRQPTQISLRKGWNHVRIVLPFYRQWGATFCLISGTSEHPREVVGLEYSASPMKCPESGRFALVEGGRPAAAIVRTGNAKVDADIAFFTNAVFRCTGASLPVVDVRKPGERAVRFAVSFGTAFDSDRHSVSFPDERTLLIEGTEDSCRWALNRILEKDFGVVFCFPGPHGTHYPRSTDVAVACAPFSGTASLAVERHLESEDPPWERCLGGRALGGPGQFYGHAMNRWLPPGEFRGTALAARIFPEKGGKRRDIPDDAKTGWQPCFSSEECAAEAAKRICAWLDTTPGARCCSISVNDLAGYCECRECERVNGGLAKKSRFHDYYDSFSEVYYTWANRVAARVAERHPGVAIGLLAYCGTIDPPSFRLHPNLMPFLCTDVHQLMDDEAAKRRAALFSAWREKAVHIGNWGYDYGPPAYVLPRPYISCCRKFFDMKKTTCPSMDGYFGEGMNYVAEGPKRYMFYRMMFDVDCDDAAELKRWYAACCGEAAAPHLEAYYRTWEEFWTGPVVRLCKAWYAGVKSTYFPFRNPSLYLTKWTSADMARATGLMEKVVAAAKASGDADQVRRAEQLAEFHSYYVTRTKACGGEFSRIGSAANAVRFLEALPGICAAAKENVRIAENIVRGKDYEKAYGYESRDWHLRGFVAMSREPVNQAVVARLNEAVRFSTASPQVVAAIEKASRDERVVPELREMLSTLMRVSSLPNLAEGVAPEKSTKSFHWYFPGFEEERDFFISFKITNRRVGKQGYWIYFAGKDTRSGRYRGGNEVMLSLGPGETRTVAFFSKTIKRTKGARLNVSAHPGELERLEDLDVTDLRVCEVDSKNRETKEAAK